MVELEEAGVVQKPDSGRPSRPRRRDRDASVATNTKRDAGRVRDLHDGSASPEPSEDAASPFALDAAVANDEDAGSTVLDASAPLAEIPTAHALAAYELVRPPFELPGIDDNASDVTWRWDTNTFFVVENSTARLSEYTSNFGTRLRRIELSGGTTDTEGLTYLGEGRFAVATEDNEVYVFVLSDDADQVDLSESGVQRYIVSAPPLVTNRGFEGVAFAAELGLGTFFTCQEGGDPYVPRSILQFEARADGSEFDFQVDLSVQEPWSAEQRWNGTMSDLSGLHYDRAAGNLLVLSHESSTLVRVAPQDGSILETMALADAPQYEGVTLASPDRLVLVSEPNLVELRRVPQ